MRSMRDAAPPSGAEEARKAVMEYDRVTIAVRHLIEYIGEDPEREGLRETPDRVMKAYKEMFHGYHIDPLSLFKEFEDGGAYYDEMVVVRDIEFYSTCEHHMLPFTGLAHVAYIPNEKILGLSKIPRLVDCFSRRLQVQERLTTQIANCLQEGTHAKGVGVVIEAKHTCVSCRGVRKQQAVMVTSKLLGAFKADEKTRSEFLTLVHNG